MESLFTRLDSNFRYRLECVEKSTLSRFIMTSLQYVVKESELTKPVTTLSFTDYSEGLERATKIYYFALAVLAFSSISCVTCLKYSNISLYIRWPCFISFPLSLCLFFYTLRQMNPYSFTHATVNFTGMKS